MAKALMRVPPIDAIDRLMLDDRSEGGLS